jgi:8-amino-7-oxononanoate synthase
VLDFTSALYLGLQHSSSSLRPWQRLTTGAPAALVEPAPGIQIERALAELQGCEAAILGTSTLHLAWDLFGLLTEKPVTIFMDAGVYPITRWGVQRAAMRGAAVRAFPHYDPNALARKLAAASSNRRPVIVTDGFCPNCGRVAPLAEYFALARRGAGLLVVDDTQALGVLGHSPSAAMPYGRGGGGSLRWSGIGGPQTLVFNSLAKGFGAPLAALAASAAWIRKFREKSLTRVHCSPPSIAALRAAEHALALNHARGDALRSRLASAVLHFRRRLREVGLAAEQWLFPVQTLAQVRGPEASALHERLLGAGVAAVLHQGDQTRAARISFIINRRHRFEEIDAAVSFIATALRAGGAMRFKPATIGVNYEEPIYH